MKKKVFIKDVEDLSEDLSKFIEKSAQLAAKYSKNSKLLSIFTDAAQSLTWRKEELDNVAKAAKNYNKKELEEKKQARALYPTVEVCEPCDYERYDFDFDEDDDEEDKD